MNRRAFSRTLSSAVVVGAVFRAVPVPDSLAASRPAPVEDRTREWSQAIYEKHGDLRIPVDRWRFNPENGRAEPAEPARTFLRPALNADGILVWEEA